MVGVTSALISSKGHGFDNGDGATSCEPSELNYTSLFHLIDNKSENRGFASIVKKLRLSKDQASRLHREISKDGLSLKEIEEIAIDLFK